jgi:hypothetical protein
MLNVDEAQLNAARRATTENEARLREAELLLGPRQQRHGDAPDDGTARSGTS